MSVAEYLTLSLGSEENLLSFSHWLAQQGVLHRIVEHRGEQQLWLVDEHQVANVQLAYQQYCDGELAIAEVQYRHASLWRRPIAALRVLSADTPLSFILILLSIAGGILVAVDRDFQLLSWLTYFIVEPVGDGRLRLFPMGEQLWRLVTPALLHFGVLHTVFNAMWLWYLGRVYEQRLGSVSLLLLFVVVAVASNAAQAWHTGPGLFGGMSGVIYGLLGFSMVWDKLRPLQAFAVPRNIVVFMLVWLLLCWFGIVRLFSDGDAANAAHLAGLLAGMVCGVIAALIHFSAGRNSSD